MPDIVSEQKWREARVSLVQKEKDLTRLRDEVTAERRNLPWTLVTKNYVFEGENGQVSFAELFGQHDQLVVQHFMFGPDWEEGCPSCSFWVDGVNGTLDHLAARGTAYAAISRGPLEKLLTYRKRMGWSIPWVSSLDNEFNFDFGVSFTPEQVENGKAEYNFGQSNHPPGEAPGFSVFAKDEAGRVYRTYSTYARGLDPINPVYQLIDFTPKGRDEDELAFPMAWVRRRDQY